MCVAYFKPPRYSLAGTLAAAARERCGAESSGARMGWVQDGAGQKSLTH
jgi:hypothetical protein